MQTEIILSGFGGQGIMFAGQLLAYAAMDSGLEVTWMPSYGPEMRGGTANCTVIISSEEIGSPTVLNPKAALVFNNPSMIKYEPLVVSGGVLIVNSSLIDREITRDEIKNLRIPANEIAESVSSTRLANMVMLGALTVMLPVIPIEGLIQALDDHIPDRHRHLLDSNFQALREGSVFEELKLVEDTVN
ncbi:2-oxoacid:acceptor oxidoreductase family protein [Chloroflexota bacterium]